MDRRPFDDAVTVAAPLRRCRRIPHLICDKDGNGNVEHPFADLVDGITEGTAVVVEPFHVFPRPFLVKLHDPPPKKRGIHPIVF